MLSTSVQSYLCLPCKHHYRRLTNPSTRFGRISERRSALIHRRWASSSDSAESIITDISDSEVDSERAKALNTFSGVCEETTDVQPSEIRKAFYYFEKNKMKVRLVNSQIQHRLEALV